MSERVHIELTPEEDRENNKAVLAHVLPFAIWLTMLVWFDEYNARTIGGIIVLLIFRPWRWYSRPKLKNIPAALGVGVFIFVVWVGLETPWMAQHAPFITEWYDRLFVDLMNPFQTRELYEIPLNAESAEIQEAVALGTDNIARTLLPFQVIKEGEHIGLHAYDPRVTGWLTFWIHMFGTTVIIAMIEEFFYRSFVYRWMQGSPFFNIKVGRVHWPMLLLVSAFFSVSHFEIGAAVICGMAFGLLYIKTQDIWAAIIAHGTTNFLLGLYVVKFNAYQFW